MGAQWDQDRGGLLTSAWRVWPTAATSRQSCGAEQAAHTAG